MTLISKIVPDNIYPSITLRPPKKSDIDLLYEWRRDPVLQKYQPLLEMTHDQLKDDFLKYGYRSHVFHDRYQWIIERVSDNQPIGWITLNIRNRQHQIGEIGYSIAPAFHHQGYATEALKQFLIIAITDIGLYRIEAKCTTDNAASYKLLEKCAFQREGILRQYLIIRNIRADHYLYSYLKS